MQALCDVNVLLALAYKPHHHHAASLTWLNAQHDYEVVLCRMSQLALLRLLTNRTVMGVDVCTHEHAWELWDMITADRRFVYFQEPERVATILRVYTQASVPSPNLWQDAYLAAFSRAAEVQFVTFDRGFQRFPDLRLQLLT
jgi:toxin-antitoxin system PIN domain toxin